MGPDLVSQLVNDERAIGSKVRYDYNSRAASPSSRLVGKTCVFVRATSFGRSPKRRASRELVRRPRGDESFVARFDARVSRLSALPLTHPLHPLLVSQKKKLKSHHRHTHSPTNRRHPRRRRREICVAAPRGAGGFPIRWCVSIQTYPRARSRGPITSQQYTAVPMDDSIGSSKNPDASSGPVGDGVRNSRPSLPPSHSTPSSMSPPCT